MIWFLNLFSAFRDAVVARIRAEDEVRSLRARLDKAEARIIELQDKMLERSDLINDGFAQRFLGHRLTSKAEVPVQPAERKPLQSRSRIQGRTAVQMETGRFQRTMAAIEKLDSQTPA